MRAEVAAGSSLVFHLLVLTNSHVHNDKVHGSNSKTSWEIEVKTSSLYSKEKKGKGNKDNVLLVFCNYNLFRILVLVFLLSILPA